MIRHVGDAFLPLLAICSADQRGRSLARTCASRWSWIRSGLHRRMCPAGDVPRGTFSDAPRACLHMHRVAVSPVLSLPGLIPLFHRFDCIGQVSVLTDSQLPSLPETSMVALAMHECSRSYRSTWPDCAAGRHIGCRNFVPMFHVEHLWSSRR